MADEYQCTYEYLIATVVTGAAADDGGAETDETAEAQSAAVNDMTLLPAVPAVNDAYYFGVDSPVSGMTLNIGTAGVGTWTVTWEYSTGSDTWSALEDIIDGTTAFTATAGNHDVTWKIPSDWATDTVAAVAGKYWVRGRVSAYTSITTQPLGTQAWYLSQLRFKTNDLKVTPHRPHLRVDTRVDGIRVVTDSGVSYRIITCTAILEAGEMDVLDSVQGASITYTGAYPRLTTIYWDGDSTETNIEVALMDCPSTDLGAGWWHVSLRFEEKDQ